VHLLLPASLVVGVLFARLGSGGVVSGVALYCGRWALRQTWVLGEAGRSRGLAWRVGGDSGACGGGGVGWS
jgi:hypothetical protein